MYWRLYSGHLIFYCLMKSLWLQNGVMGVTLVLQRTWFSVLTVSTHLPFLLLLSAFSSSSSSQSDVLRKSKLPRAVSTVRLTTLGERLCLPPCTHTQIHSQTTGQESGMPSDAQQIHMHILSMLRLAHNMRTHSQTGPTLISNTDNSQTAACRSNLHVCVFVWICISVDKHIYVLIHVCI